ncbi:LysR family transcriptional regulator [Labrys okinawensis]|uniref:LysR family transcriptional regulator n=1 Tax=Labrys okinawensis TaxID=346911 RepID=UPI0039BCABEE
MDWSDIRIFLAIARAGTLGAAARSLGLTQPTMGRRLRALEESLGHVLFQRTSDGFILTDEGSTVLARAERMEQEALGLERELAGQEHELEGTLRLSCSDWFGLHILSPILADFSLSHPRVVVELLTDTRLLSLSRREADLAFRIRRFSEPDVVSRRLMHIGYNLYTRSGTPWPAPGDGAGYRIVTMDEAFAGMPDVEWLMRTFPSATIAMRSNSRDVQATLCAGGVGLAVLPRPLGDATPGIERVDLPVSPPGRETWLGYHRDLRRLPRLRALLDMVIARLAPVESSSRDPSVKFGP